MFELSSQQSELLHLSERWYKRLYKQTFEISGPAGSGKTSVIYQLIKNLKLEPHQVLFVAYVGKAVLVLKMKGNNAKTIHSAFYDIADLPRYDSDGEIMRKNGRILTYPGFVKKEFIDPEVKLIVIDEGGMVNTSFGNDILSFDIPVIVLGDLNQLDPVIGEPSFLLKPDYILTEIHRQAKDNPIIKLSQMAINKQIPKIGEYGPKCYVIPKSMMDDTLMKTADIIICGKNETRFDINTYYRQTLLGIKYKYPVIGDKVICRKNNWNLKINDNIFLTNGMVGNIKDIYMETFDDKSVCIDFKPEFLPHDMYRKIPMNFKRICDPKEGTTYSRFNRYNEFEYGYSITGHLSQGSQYNNVLVYNEKFGSWDSYFKWLYTVITRAVDGLVIAV